MKRIGIIVGSIVVIFIISVCTIMLTEKAGENDTEINASTNFEETMDRNDVSNQGQKESTEANGSAKVEETMDRNEVVYQEQKESPETIAVKIVDKLDKNDVRKKIANYVDMIQDDNRIAIPEFTDINEADEDWIWNVVDINVRQLGYSYDEYIEKDKLNSVKTIIFGDKLSKEVPKEAYSFSYYSPNLYELHWRDCYEFYPDYYLKNIEEVGNKYKVEIIPYILYYPLGGDIEDEEEIYDLDMNLVEFVKNGEVEKVMQAKENELHKNVLMLEVDKEGILHIVSSKIEYNEDRSKTIKKIGASGFAYRVTDRIIPLYQSYDFVNNFSEGLAKVRKGEKYGYIDKTGKEIIPLIYDDAGDFSEGMARVELNGKYGYIDKLGKEVTSCVYDGNYACGNFSEGLAYVRKNGKYGYIDKTGKEIIPLVYDDAGDFSEGLARVDINGMYGYIDKKGEIIIRDICKAIIEGDASGGDFYDFCNDFKEGIACVKKGAKYGYIDKKGNNIISYIYDDAGDFSEGLAYVRKDGKYGYIDKQGKEVIPCIYDDGYNFSEGLAWVKKAGKIGCIDKTGKEIIPFIYDNNKSVVLPEFSEGLSYVEKNGKYGYVNKEGKEVIPCNYCSEYFCTYNFFSGLAEVGKKHDGLGVNSDDDITYGYIDRAGNEVIPCIFDRVYFNDEIVVVQHSDWWYLIKII